MGHQPAMRDDMERVHVLSVHPCPSMRTCKHSLEAVEDVLIQWPTPPRDSSGQSNAVLLHTADLVHMCPADTTCSAIYNRLRMSMTLYYVTLYFIISQLGKLAQFVLQYGSSPN